jgi:hypothetical protein
MDKEIPSCEEPNSPALPAIERATDLLADTTNEIPPQIVHGVLHQGLKGVLGGNSKARKTWILLDLALCVATGSPWWKFATTKGKVLYINFEIPRYFISERINSLCDKKDVSDISNLDVWNLRGKAAPLGKLVPEIISQIRDKKYSLVIIDPIYKGLGGRDENSAGDISELCNELERVAVETGAAVVYAAHFSKGNQAGKEAMDRISGSGVWTRDADTIITMTKHKEEQDHAYTVDLILRNLPEQEPFVVAWQFPLMTLREDLDPDDLKQAKGRKSTYEEADVLGALGKEHLTTKDWQERAKAEGISSSTFFRLRKKLEVSGRIVKGEDDKWESVPTKISFAKSPLSVGNTEKNNLPSEPVRLPESSSKGASGPSNGNPFGCKVPSLV